MYQLEGIRPINILRNIHIAYNEKTFFATNVSIACLLRDNQEISYPRYVIIIGIKK